MEKRAYGYVNGEPATSADDFVYKCRQHTGFHGLGRYGPIESDEELIEFARKVTSNWYDAGWHQTFTGYYLGDYALDEPKRSLTDREYARLKELQKEQIEAEKRADEAREWHFVERVYYADNSIEEVWEDKDGIRKTVMVDGPHGDVCY